MEGRYRGLLEAAPDAMVVVNQQGEIVLLNKQAESQFGYRRDELVGQKVKNIIPEGFAERLIADALRSTEDALAQQIGAGIELVGRRKNGSAFPIEIMLSPLESAEGILVTAAIRDITTRKNDQMAFRRTMEMLQQIIESSPVAIVNLDADARIVTWNRRAEEIFGYSAREAIGRPYVDLVGKSDADSLGELREVLTGRMVRSVEIERKRKNGSTVVLSVAAAALTDHGKSPVGIVALFEDITHAKETRAQLQHVQKMEAVGQLSGGIAHDFNNLLSVIIGNLDSLLIRLTSEKEREIAKNALKGALRCAELTRQMLAFARRQELDPVQIDAGAMLRNLSVALERMLGEMVKVETNTPEDLWPCVADEDQVESALLNLAVNARDAMPEGGTLTIDASNARLDASYAARNSEVEAGDYVKFSVSDTGTGMSPELRARSMEPFFTTKDPGKGTGLGLSMVHGFAKQSGGHVKIYSEVGFGTTVNLFLPRVLGAQLAASESEESAATTNQGNETILVVDDNIEVRATACMQLTELGYRVIEAGDGKSALEILGNATTIDLVFSDVVMPGGMTGFDLARNVYRDHPEIKMLLVTGFAGAVLRQHLEVGESMPMLRKPYRRDELAARVRQVLDAKWADAAPALVANSGEPR
jgi:PAS domain S-box-containing protein